ncbi:MAG: T9SS type A sorting domain-containing protein [Sphingobacteriales bacterium]|nr:MAG: T9SS type A sorting domain-containing protein [Sphingobacteriales bacterium]
MKKLYLILSALALSGQMHAKQVDVTTAKKVGFNFLVSKLNADALTKAEDLQLVYTAADKSSNFYYVFNAGNAGFVMVSADDVVLPVFGYSNEGLFTPGNVAPATSAWLKNYEGQIRRAIEQTITASTEAAAQWHILLNGKASGANKTTAVSPLVKTKWNQGPYENLLCPTNGMGQAVTGCVATSMAQIMKFWNYPLKGIGTHTYNPSGFATQTVNFGATTYNWAVMPLGTALPGSSTAAKTAVATLMWHVGVSVEMQYGVNSSGAWVIDKGSPCSQDAFVRFFGYDASISSEERDNVPSESAWKAIIKKELDAGRPIMYVGYTPPPSSGHAWVCDGYDASDFFHMNWGWGGMSDGNFLVSNLDPSAVGTGGGSGDGFDLGQQVLIGIQPASSVPADAYEANNTVADAKKVPTPAIVNHKGNTSLSASIHNASDEDYYEIVTPNDNHQYRVTARMQDKKFANNSKTYTIDAKFAGNTSKLALNTFNDTLLAKPINAAGNTSVYFKVVPFTLGTYGTYQLDITVTDITTGVSEITSMEDVAIYPNPATNMLNIVLNGTKASSVSLTDVQGRIITNVAVADNDVVAMDLGAIASGTYFVRIATETVIITKKISINK